MDGVVRRPSRGMLPFLALNVANEFYRLERKPPVTAGLLLANTLIYLRPGVLDALLPTIDEVWFNPHIIVKVGNLFSSAILFSLLFFLVIGLFPCSFSLGEELDLLFALSDC